MGKDARIRSLRRRARRCELLTTQAPSRQSHALPAGYSAEGLAADERIRPRAARRLLLEQATGQRSIVTLVRAHERHLLCAKKLSSGTTTDREVVLWATAEHAAGRTVR